MCVTNPHRKSGKKLRVAFRVPYECANDPAASKKGAPHVDFQYAMQADVARLEGNTDTQPTNDELHPAFATDVVIK